MARRVLITIFAAVVLLNSAAKKTTATARAENEDLILTVTLALLPEDVKALVGTDLPHIIVADVKVEPKYGKEVNLDRDDFVLRTDKDGEKSKPFAASQIAGRGALVNSEKSSSEGVRSPGWSGMGGPMIIGGGGGGIGKGSDVDTSTPKATVQNDENENPLKKVLESKILPQGKILKPVTGLLYFPMDKQKMKDLELTYGGRENRIT